jgi:hypothetical protein
MSNQKIPIFCKACIERFQAKCPHLHTRMFGGFHFTAGEVWDDLTLICLDCGANLDELPLPEEITIEEEIP